MVPANIIAIKIPQNSPTLKRFFIKDSKKINKKTFKKVFNVLVNLLRPKRVKGASKSPGNNMGKTPSLCFSQ